MGQVLDWLCRAFGLAERLRVVRDGIISHAQLTVGEGASVLGRQRGPFRAPHGDAVAAYVHVTVEDVNAHHERAAQNGARMVQRPHDIPFGERQYTAFDPAGHRWTFSQNIADVAPESWAPPPGPEDNAP